MDNHIILKVCCNDWSNASRDKRELSLYRELGFNVAVLAKGQAGDKGQTDDVSGFKVYRYTTRPLGNKIPISFNRMISLFFWAKFIRKIHPQVISGHDILGVTIGWLYNTFFSKEEKSVIIYDSHEFEIGRNAKRNKIQTALIKYWERFLIRRCAFTITVCDSIADELQKIHKLKERPLVVRSVPEQWNTDSSVCEEKRTWLLREFGGKITNLALYHGNIRKGAGLPRTFEIIKHRETLALVLMGAVSEKDRDNLQKLANDLGIAERIRFLPPVEQRDIWQYSGAADFEIMLIEPVVKSYYFALPNKFFEAVQSETPVITSNLPEMKRLVEKYDIGFSCNPEDIEEILHSIDLLCEDKALHAHFKENIKTAKKELCWENEKNILIDAVRKYIG